MYAFSEIGSEDSAGKKSDERRGYGSAASLMYILTFYKSMNYRPPGKNAILPNFWVTVKNKMLTCD